jgi:RNA polymerase sigma factor (sigma-70 family)
VARNEGPPDEDLLEQFFGGAESESEDAFRTLVARHGRMVLRVCRCVLDQEEDAEDAFQATFLVLALRGASIRDRSALVGWLREVAYRIAIKVRARTFRRRAVERRGATLVPTRIQPDSQTQEIDWSELRPIVHEEIIRLPEKYRLPMVLSYLEGKTNEEVADLLQWPLGTVKGRLMRARELLRWRLGRRGVALSAALLVTALDQRRTRAGGIPAERVYRAVRRVAAFRAGTVQSWRSTRLFLGLLGILVFLACLSLGVFWAAAPDGRSPHRGSWFSGLTPPRSDRAGSCH